MKIENKYFVKINLIDMSGTYNENVTMESLSKRTDSTFQTLSKQLILDMADVHVTCIGHDMCE